MGLFSSLNREQKESVGLLSIGTFLEYFDLMLYVHMAVLLNELFFPKYDTHATSILAAAVFSSTFILRPIGALFFGWIGDHIGRKSTIVITTAIMASSCIIMANLPTYAQIGIAATWVITICRILQGISSMGESVVAEIYLAESIPYPIRFPMVAFVSVSATLGGFFALGLTSFVTSFTLNWRIVFWIGTVIALVSLVARTRLRETAEFLEMKKKQMKKEVEEMNLEEDPIGGAEFNATWKEPVNKKTLASYFFISCGTPLCFYLAFIYFNPILTDNFGYSSTDIIIHNTFLSLISVIASISVALLTYRVHPLIINKVRGLLTLLLMVLMPFLVARISNPAQLFVMQTLIILLPLDDMPSSAVFLRYFPLYRRVTCASILFATSRALTYVLTSFGLVYLGTYFGPFGIWFISIPIAVSFLYGIRYFEGLERQLGFYPNLVRRAAQEG